MQEKLKRIKLLLLDVDGIMTDDPRTLRDVLVARGRWKDYRLA